MPDSPPIAEIKKAYASVFGVGESQVCITTNSAGDMNIRLVNPQLKQVVQTIQTKVSHESGATHAGWLTGGW